ncbi:MAG TPA: response regulator transcription factor [Pseudoxanthomonas sp.]|jgi:DNA-binding NarL/FixJ family response regulator|nr:response regulator transcription factor [Pseudoxanthomonas sp.]
MEVNGPSSYPTTRLLIADDHRVVAQGVERLLLECFEHVEVVQSGEAIIDCVLAERTDLVIADISMQGISGIEAMRRVRQLGYDTPFIFLTMHGDCRVAAEAIRSGASGYLLKSSAGEELVRAIREVQSGRSYVTPTLAGPTIFASEQTVDCNLTEKQQRILDYVAQGLRSKQIAYELGISVRTVESHKYAIMQQLGVHGTVELVRKAEQLGLLPGSPRQRSAA